MCFRQNQIPLPLARLSEALFRSSAKEDLSGERKEKKENRGAASFDRGQRFAFQTFLKLPIKTLETLLCTTRPRRYLEERGSIVRKRKGKGESWRTSEGKIPNTPKKREKKYLPSLV